MHMQTKAMHIPRYAAQMLIHELSLDLEELGRSNPDSVFILAGDFNSLETSFLCDDFGLQQLVVTPTHGSKTIDKMFVSHQDIYITAQLSRIY